MKQKIQNIENLEILFSKLKSEGKKIVHCHGVFYLLHVGHTKHFKRQVDQVLYEQIHLV
jgi:bifunctional ADP-heptose synthase (sugar kinase/adenylyltransferase)